MRTNGLMAPKIWSPSSRALTDPYYAIREQPVAVPVSQRLRRPVLLGVSVMMVTSAVYLGFIRSNDSVVGTPIAVSGKVKTQNVTPPVAIANRPTPVLTARRLAPVRSPPIPPPAAAPPASHQVATASSDAKHNPASQVSGPISSPISSQASNQPAKPRVNAARQLRAARANLQRNNLSATKTRLAAAIAAQPDNPDALRLRKAVASREQQRDALLSVARGCGYIAQWSCVQHSAGDALAVDSSSQEAQRLVTFAMRESELTSAWPSAPTPEAAPDPHGVAISHH